MGEQGSRDEEQRTRGLGGSSLGPKLKSLRDCKMTNTSLSGPQNISGDSRSQLDPHRQHKCHRFHVNNLWKFF